MPDRLDRILTAALDDCGPSRDDCAYLLGLPSESLESATLMAVADTVSRRRFKNEAMLLGQIGLETVPCPGNCKFCAFGKSHTAFERTELPMEEILLRAHSFADGEDLYALFLMTMHELEFERILSIVETVRDEIPSHTQIVVNVGDFGLAQAREMRSAGVNGAYHVCRLREGVDTDLDPQERKKTFSVIREAGLHFYYCCEPIGPEHAAQELADQIFLGIEHDC
ncbi:hypothetical protein H8D79_01615, partial [PVC group bacterium]|nr:hypothetical protein [PVC group bacterium]